MAVEEFASSVYSALNRDLSDIVYDNYSYRNGTRAKDGTRTRRPHREDIEIYCFPQTWGSTALGFGGIGGSAMTTAMTVIVTRGREACVYFGGQFAYRIDKVNDVFYSDARSYNMKDVMKSDVYERRSPQAKAEAGSEGE